MNNSFRRGSVIVQQSLLRHTDAAVAIQPNRVFELSIEDFGIQLFFCNKLISLDEIFEHNNEGIIFKKLRYISAVANSQLSICVHNCGIFTDSTFEFKDYNRNTIYKDTALSESMKRNM